MCSFPAKLSWLYNMHIKQSHIEGIRDTETASSSAPVTFCDDHVTK